MTTGPESGWLLPVLRKLTTGSRLCPRDTSNRQDSLLKIVVSSSDKNTEVLSPYQVVHLPESHLHTSISLPLMSTS